MKKTLLASSIIALTLTAASTSFAATEVGSGAIEFNGVVNTGACTIAPTSVNKEVDLGSVPASSLKTAGAQGPQTDFSLELSDCVLEVGGEENPYSKVSIAFNGVMDGAGKLWENIGTSQNVGILFQDENGKNLTNQAPLEQQLKSGINVINLSARMQALGQASAGTVKSTVSYVLTYQ